MIHIPRNDVKSLTMPVIKAMVLSRANWSDDGKYTLTGDFFCAHSAMLETRVEFEPLFAARGGIAAATQEQIASFVALGQKEEIDAADGSYTFGISGAKPAVDIPVLVTVSRVAKG